MKVQLSLGQVRDRLAADGVDVPLWRLKYAMDAGRIQHAGRVGVLRTWPESALPRIKTVVQRIAAKHTRGGSL